MSVDEIGLEALSGREIATDFWKSMGFKSAERFLFRKRLE